MARIPDAELERLKTDVSLRCLIEEAGYVLKPQGKDFGMRCPFHEGDNEPSLIVSPAKNLFHCFACGAAGSPIDWVMRTRGVSFRHAVELLRQDAPLAADDQSRRARVLLPTPIVPDAGNQQLLDAVIGFYHETLLASPEALAYLTKRGLDDRELIGRFRLGFANRTLGLRLPVTQVKAGAEVRGRLQELGLLRASGHEHFRGCLTIPVFDAQGQVTEVYGRRIDDHVREGTPRHLYLPGPHRGVWNLDALRSSQEIILTESLIDALTFWRAGYRNVTASYGVEGFTDEHLAAFREHGTQRVLIAYDADDAGNRAADALAQRLIGAGIACYRLHFPKGMDANEYALKSLSSTRSGITPASESLGVVIRSAQWLGEGAAPAGQQEEKDTCIPAIESPPVAEAPVLPLAAALVPAASPVTTPVIDAPTQVDDDEVVMHLGDRRYRVRGLAKNLSPQTLKINLLVSREPAYYVDTFDLYSARQRQQYLGSAAKEIGVREDVIKGDLGRLLLALEGLQERRIKAALTVTPAAPAIGEEERAAAFALLRDPALLDRIVADLAACGLVGEAGNKRVAYLAATSRKLAAPLAVVVQSSSAAGKSSLMDAVLAFVPEEERVKYSAMTGQSLFYMGQTNLKHKVLAIVEEEGASRASYALKLLQSEGELTIASTGKDPATGNLVTQEYRVEGPVMMFLTTTAIEIDEELLNRCMVLSVDEGREQTAAIHERQRYKRTLAGLTAQRHKQHLITLHQNAQRLLRPLAVVNPYADRLTFLADQTRTRRDHEKYLTLIDTLALLHQYQRPIKMLAAHGEAIEYVEVTLADIAQANVLAHEVLGRSLDELPPQTRRLLAALIEYVRARCAALALERSALRFSRRELREHTGLADTQLRVHLERLVELEYLLVHRGGRGQSFEYELLFDGDAQEKAPHLSGLIDPAQLQSSRGESPRFAGSTRPQRAPSAGASRAREQPAESSAESLAASSSENAHPRASARANGNGAAYVVAEGSP